MEKGEVLSPPENCRNMPTEVEQDGLVIDAEDILNEKLQEINLSSSDDKCCLNDTFAKDERDVLKNPSTEVSQNSHEVSNEGTWDQLMPPLTVQQQVELFKEAQRVIYYIISAKPKAVTKSTSLDESQGTYTKEKDVVSISIDESPTFLTCCELLGKRKLDVTPSPTTDTSVFSNMSDDIVQAVNFNPNSAVLNMPESLQSVLPKANISPDENGVVHFTGQRLAGSKTVVKTVSHQSRLEGFKQAHLKSGLKPLGQSLDGGKMLKRPRLSRQDSDSSVRSDDSAWSTTSSCSTASIPSRLPNRKQFNDVPPTMAKVPLVQLNTSSRTAQNPSGATIKRSKSLLARSTWPTSGLNTGTASAVQAGGLVAPSKLQIPKLGRPPDQLDPAQLSAPKVSTAVYGKGPMKATVPLSCMKQVTSNSKSPAKTVLGSKIQRRSSMSSPSNDDRKGLQKKLVSPKKSNLTNSKIAISKSLNCSKGAPSSPAVSQLKRPNLQYTPVGGKHLDSLLVHSGWSPLPKPRSFIPEDESFVCTKRTSMMFRAGSKES